MAFIYCVLKADEDARGDTNDKDETEDDERGNKNEDEQAIIILRIPGLKSLMIHHVKNDPIF